MSSQQDAAAEVLAHLVSLRGGAPFLSPTDARLLMGWLNQGVPVPLLLHALEQAAEARRKKRLRTPLSLRAAKKAVMKWTGEPPPTPVPEPRGALGPLIQALRDSGRAAYLPVISAFEGLDGEREAIVGQALQISRAFFEQTWEQGDRAAWMAQAREELTSLEGQVPAPRLAQLVEEVARDLMRQDHPLLSATRIWDTVGG